MSRFLAPPLFAGAHVQTVSGRPDLAMVYRSGRRRLIPIKGCCGPTTLKRIPCSRASECRRPPFTAVARHPPQAFSDRSKLKRNKERLPLTSVLVPPAALSARPLASSPARSH